jgi:hypothetical protein
VGDILGVYSVIRISGGEFLAEDMGKGKTSESGLQLFFRIGKQLAA